MEIATANKNKLEKWQKAFFKKIEAKGRSLNTIKNYRTDLACFNQYVTESAKQTSIEHYSIPEILEYGKYLESKYNSDNSRRRRVQALRIFFDHLVEEGVFNANPVRKIPTSPKFLDIPRPATFSHIKSLWHTLLNDQRMAKNDLEKLKAKRNGIIFSAIYLGGLKVSELSKIKVSSFSFRDEIKAVITHEKRDPYTVTFPAIFGRLFYEYIELLEKVKKEQGHNFPHLLFNANAHKILSGGLSARGMELLFEEWRSQLMIQITPKSLRQSCIFTWLHNGVNETTMKEWLGVSPAYSLKPYKEHMDKHFYNDQFIELAMNEDKLI
ncbi:site-specific recombinase, phage integrase family [Bacteriovorax sp. BAL6_X]|uniref:tyrosine-type recombinase/integrase n=1 Tax=Bacteriovorax sp. BAL6_X TaxID=1201290 RepID=UPI000386B736|nr:site-specific integrase [Bacteriovorax sp. BAL6_X]EPZ50674.1 site-specific recombinase, phage integrase family [Bacteriovorax sp. BAL6_X]